MHNDITDSISTFLVEYFQEWEFVQDDGQKIAHHLVFSKDGFLPMFAHFAKGYAEELFGDLSKIDITDYADALLSTRSEIRGECGSLILCVLIEVIEEICLMKDTFDNKINITQIYSMISQNKHPTFKP